MYKISQAQNKGSISLLAGLSIVGGYYNYKYRMQVKRLANLDYFYNSKIYLMQKDMDRKEAIWRKNMESLEKELGDRMPELEFAKVLKKSAHHE